MPTTYARPAVQDFKGNKIHTYLDQKTVKRIEELSKETGTTPYIVLLSAYYILLSKYTSQEDIIIGSPIVGRDMVQTTNIIGMFVNTLALRNKVNSKISFKDFVEIIKENIFKAFKYQIYPFDELINTLEIKRDTSRNPLFDTMFSYKNKGFSPINLSGLKTQYYIPDTNVSKFDLSVEAIPDNTGKINISFEYATKLYAEEVIKNLAEHYLNIIKTILINPNIKIEDIEILSDKEKKKIVYEFNNTQYDYPRDKTISELKDAIQYCSCIWR